MDNITFPAPIPDKSFNDASQTSSNSNSNSNPTTSSLFDIAWSTFDVSSIGFIQPSQIIDLALHLESLLNLPKGTSLLNDEILSRFDEFISSNSDLRITKEDFILLFDELIDSKIIDLNNDEIFGDFNDEYVYYNDNLDNLIKKEIPDVINELTADDIKMKLSLRNSLIEEIELEQDHLITLIKNSPIKLKHDLNSFCDNLGGPVMKNEILLDGIETDSEIDEMEEMDEIQVGDYIPEGSTSLLSKLIHIDELEASPPPQFPTTPPRSFHKLNKMNTSSTTSLKQDLDELEYTHNLITSNFDKLEKNLINIKSQNVKDLSNLNKLFNKYYQNDNEISVLQKQLSDINAELNKVKEIDIDNTINEIKVEVEAGPENIAKEIQNEIPIGEQVDKSIDNIDNDYLSSSSLSNSSSLSINLISDLDSNKSKTSLKSSNTKSQDNLLLNAPVISRTKSDTLNTRREATGEGEEKEQLDNITSIKHRMVPTREKSVKRVRSHQRIILQIEETKNDYIFYIVLSIIFLFIGLLKYYFP